MKTQVLHTQCDVALLVKLKGNSDTIDNSWE